MNFTQFRFANTKRCRDAFHPIDEWSPTDWACALGGEVGELQTLICDTATRTVSNKEIGREVADVVAYLDLLCVRMGIDLEAMVIANLKDIWRGGLGSLTAPLNFDQFQREIKKACDKSSPETSSFFLACELGAATGELLNVIKKLRRGLYGDRTSLPELGGRAALVLVALSLLASSLDINLEAATISKFNEVSKKVGSKVFIEARETGSRWR